MRGSGPLDEAQQKAMAERIQVHALEKTVTHAYLGQWYQPVALRSNGG